MPAPHGEATNERNEEALLKKVKAHEDDKGYKHLTGEVDLKD